MQFNRIIQSQNRLNYAVVCVQSKTKYYGSAGKLRRGELLLTTKK